MSWALSKQSVRLHQASGGTQRRLTQGGCGRESYPLRIRLSSFPAMGEGHHLIDSSLGERVHSSLYSRHGVGAILTEIVANGPTPSPTGFEDPRKTGVPFLFKAA
jgi:hypothetical protein